MTSRTIFTPAPAAMMASRAVKFDEMVVVIIATISVIVIIYYPYMVPPGELWRNP